MQTSARFLAVFLFAVAALHAGSSLEHARRAQALLGTDVWSRIVRIENSTRLRDYPRTLHALLFEFEGLLWFYFDQNGTQSLSLHRGRLAEEKADLGTLLRAIEPGFGRWSIVEAGARSAGRASDGPLPNGCFIESIVAWRQRIAAGQAISNPRLLSYYFEKWDGRGGHTVFAYETRDGVEIVDPAQPGRRFLFPRGFGDDVLALARELEGAAVVRARTLPLTAQAAALAFAAKNDSTDVTVPPAGRLASP